MNHMLFVLSIFAVTLAGAQEMPVIPESELQQDVDILVKALKEAHTGVFWYTPETEFDQLETTIRQQISGSGGQTALTFYNTIAPYVALTKEDHCDISPSKETSAFLKAQGRYFPFPVKFCSEKAYLIGTEIPGTMELNGYELLAVNNVSLTELTEHLFATFAADGNIVTSKYRWLDGIGFSRLYTRTIQWSTDRFELLVRIPGSGTTQQISVGATGYAEFIAAFKKHENALNTKKRPAELKIESDYAILTIRTFLGSEYTENDMPFESFIDSCFRAVNKSDIRNLIIDIRENGGGTEGSEDYLYSWLATKPYNKYRFVETNALTYSFFEYTDYADPTEQKEFEKLLRKEFKYDPASGKYHRKAKIERPEEPQKKPYTGQLYILAGGVTYSGGAEFSSLVKYNRKAVFVGEEVGGGYFGNTSGYSMTLALPHSGVQIDIPIVRFVLDVGGQPAGTGVLPDYPVQPDIDLYLSGIDTELLYTIGLIRTVK